jgi:hypothetical protein
MNGLLLTGVELTPAEEALYAGATNGLTVLAGSRPSLQTCRQAEHAQYLR